MAFVVVATWKAQPGEEDSIAKVIEVMTPLSRAEEHNLHYQGHTDDQEPGTFLLYECYTDEAGFEAHRASPHFQAHVLGEAVPRLAERHLRTYHTL